MKMKNTTRPLSHALIAVVGMVLCCIAMMGLAFPQEAPPKVHQPTLEERKDTIASMSSTLSWIGSTAQAPPIPAGAPTPPAPPGHIGIALRGEGPHIVVLSVVPGEPLVVFATTASVFHIPPLPPGWSPVPRIYMQWASWDAVAGKWEQYAMEVWLT